MSFAHSQHEALFALEQDGYFGRFGGSFIPEILHSTLEELKQAFVNVCLQPEFWRDYVEIMQTYSCRPTPITHLANLSKVVGGAQIYMKREDLNHTGAHKANNVMGLPCQEPGRRVDYRPEEVLGAARERKLCHVVPLESECVRSSPRPVLPMLNEGHRSVAILKASCIAPKTCTTSL